MIELWNYNSFTKVSVYLCFIFFLSSTIFGQNQKVADSLVKIYKEDKFLNSSEKLELLRNLAFNETIDFELSLKYADELIALAKLENNYLYLHRGYFQKGNKNRLAGNLNQALDAYFNSGQAAIKARYATGEGASYSSIADVYSVMGNTNNAEIYYNKSIEILRKTPDTIFLATTLLNAGDEYSKNYKYNLALQYFKEAGFLFKKVRYLIGTAYILGDIGMLYAKQGKDDLAMKNMGEAIKILEKLGDYYAISDYLIYMSDIYLKRNDWTTAVAYAKRSLELAQKRGLKEQISKSNLTLSNLYEKAGDIPESFNYYKKHIVYRDSVNNVAAVQKMADLRTNYEVSQKQSEVDLLNQGKKNQQIVTVASMISLALIFLLAVGLYRRYQFIKKTNQIIEAEKSRSDSLLLNILPEETAHELKQNGKVLAKKFESVTVLFTDFAGFTQYAEYLSPEKLVESVDYYFSKFDAIIEKYDLEKIKTVGDSYMCAGGLPFPSTDHANKMALAAIEIVEFVKDSKINNPLNQIRFEVRVGINTGPVVAGVVGTKKFAYDIWGDTVNIASRMETNSEPGKINVSENTFELVKDAFDCVFRGEVEVKNRGMMKMYFLNNMK